jgi:hypothetical protein
MAEDREAFDQRMRFHIYDHALRTGAVPGSAALAGALGAAPDAVRRGLRRLADAHIVALQPGSGEILMAMPFSAVPTPFVVRAARWGVTPAPPVWAGVTGARLAYANCVWDALGIPAMLGEDAVIETACGDCGEALRLQVADGQARPDAEGGAGVAHFALPVARWWDDIVFT